MSYPADVATVVVTGSWTPAMPGATVATGKVTFTPTAVLSDAGTGVIIEQTRFQTALDATGSISATLMATDDPHLAPSGWVYEVREEIDGYVQRVYLLAFPAAGTPFVLGHMVPLANPPPLISYILLTSVGQPNGVASLDSTGQVPAGQLVNAPSHVPITYNVPGVVAVATGTARVYNDYGRTLTFKAVRASVGTPPTGASLICDVRKNGTTIFTTPANRPTVLAAGSTSGKVTNMDVTTWEDGTYLTVDVAQVGSSVAGSDLTVEILVS